MIKQLDVIIKQCVHFLGIVELFGDRLLNRIQNFISKKSLWTKTLVYLSYLIQILIVQELVYHVDTPYILTERKYGLDIWLRRDITITILIATNAHIRNCVIIPYIFLKLIEFHLLSTPTCLRRRQETTHSL